MLPSRITRVNAFFDKGNILISIRYQLHSASATTHHPNGTAGRLLTDVTDSAIADMPKLVNGGAMVVDLMKCEVKSSCCYIDEDGKKTYIDQSNKVALRYQQM
jgi:hypothetical protein